MKKWFNMFRKHWYDRTYSGFATEYPEQWMAEANSATTSDYVFAEYFYGTKREARARINELCNGADPDPENGFNRQKWESAQGRLKHEA